MTKLKISPSEAWLLDYPELHHLLNLGESSNAGDVSMMINAERRANGARDDRYLIK